MSEEWTEVTPDHCDHIALYYQLKWEAHKCIAWQALRRGYFQWSAGRIETANNLFS